VSEVDFTSVLGSDLLELFIDVLDNKLGGVLDAEIGDESDGELSLDRTWDDCLGSNGGCSSVYALHSRLVWTYRKHLRYREATNLGSLGHQLVPLQTSNQQLTHSTHEGGNGIIRKSLISTNSILNIGNLEMDILELLLLIIGKWGDQVVDTRDQDLSLG